MRNRINAVIVPMVMGIVKLRIILCEDVRRQTSKGPTPVKNKRTKPIGIFTWLKNGAPTVIFVPLTASEMTGNNVPQNTAKHITTNTTLLNKNPLSLDVNDSIRLSDCKNFFRLTNRVNEPNNIRITKPIKMGPKDDAVNEWTEDMTPLRVKMYRKCKG